MRPLALDLFCGAVGAWSLGLHRAGYETVAACEIDPWRRAIFSHNFPSVRMYEDVRSLRADRLVQYLGRVPDIVVGSPPCQDASAANTKGRGVDSERTGLFFEAVRLVGECRPRWCAFENSHRLRTRGYDRIAESLEALGYACWPPVVGADDIGAPHKRKRVWIVAFDTTSFGDGRRWPWRCGSNGLVAASVEEHAADSESQQRWTGFARSHERQEPCDRAPDAPDTISDRIWIEPGWRGGTDGTGAAIAPDYPNANRESEHGFALHAEMAGQLDRAERHAQLAALERAIGPAVHSWNGGAARHLGMAHGVAARLADIRVADGKHPGHTVNAAKACIAAHGDAILPQIAEAIGRSILRTEAALAHVRGSAA